MDVLGIVVGGALLVMVLAVVLRSPSRSRYRVEATNHGGSEAAWFAGGSVDCSSDAGGGDAGGCDGGGGGGGD